MSLGHGNFNGILATSSIEMAQRYYQAFKEYKKQNPNPIDKDWPRIAITYSITENGDDTITNHEQMKQVLKDYEEQYGPHFDMKQLSEYNDEVAKRAARRERAYANLPKDKEINLVIVVKRLLTGFDAPRLNTLFVDRMLEYQELIQAYSRTNRLQNKELKQEGQIVRFRRPYTMKRNEENAYKLYSGEGSFALVERPDYETARDIFARNVIELKKIAATPDAADDLKGNHAKANFVKVFRKINSQLNSLSMYDQFSWDDSEKFGITEKEFEHYVGKFQRIKNEVINAEEKGSFDELENLDFSLSVGSITLVDYDYITNLIQDWLDQQREMTDAQAQENMSDYIKLSADIYAKIDELEKLGHPKEAQVLREEANRAEKIVNNQLANGQAIDVNIREENEKYETNQLHQKVAEFAKLWGLNPEALLRVAHEHELGSDVWPHEQELITSADMNAAKAAQIAKCGKPQFTIMPIYRIKSEQAWRNFIEKDIAVYLKK